MGEGIAMARSTIVSELGVDLAMGWAKGNPMAVFNAASSAIGNTLEEEVNLTLRKFVTKKL